MSEIRMLLDEIRELKRRLQALETRQEHPGFAASDVARLSVANTFAGIQTIPNTGLHLLDTNASHDLIVKPGSDLTADRTLTVTTGDADRTVTLSGNLTVPATGTAALLATANIFTAQQTVQSNSQAFGVLSTATDVAGDRSQLWFVRSRGTHASPTGVQDGDILGTVLFRGRNGSLGADSTAAGFYVYADGEWATAGDTTDAPGRFEILTTPDGSSTPVPRIVIKNSGLVGFGTSSPEGRHHINGTTDDEQLIVEAHSTQTSALVEYRDSAGAVMSGVRGNGGWIPASLADANAANNTIYYSTTAAKLVYKDGAGVVNNLY